MKTYLKWTFLILCIAKVNERAGGAEANEWGSVVKGAQMSLNLEKQGAETKTNYPTVLQVGIRNVSNEPFYVVKPNLQAPIYFEVTYPSGKRVETKKKVAKDPVSGSQQSSAVKPGGKIQLPFRLVDICPVSESGEYTVIAKGDVLMPSGLIEISSSALKFSVSAQKESEAAEAAEALKPKGF